MKKKLLALVLASMCFSLCLICAACGNKNDESNDEKNELKFTLVKDKEEDYYVVSGIGSCTDKDIVIPSEYNDKPVKGISSKAFTNCDTITSVTIPDSVTKIESAAFFMCSSLKSVTIPDSVTSIGSYAFAYCKSLTSIVISDKVVEISGYAFEKSENLTIYCQVDKKLDGWHKDWNFDNRPVVWGYGK